MRDEDNPEGDIEIQIIGTRPGEKLNEELTETGDLTPTKYPKILTTPQVFPSEIEVAKSLRDLRRSMTQRDTDRATEVLFEAVSARDAEVATPGISSGANAPASAKVHGSDPDLIVTTP